MRVTLLALLCLLARSQYTNGEEADVRLCEPWQSAYEGNDATGEQVIALWQFKPGAELKDSSGKGYDLKLQGATINPEGRFGSCLESYRGYPVEGTKRHAAIADNHPSLTPKGAFSIEMWIKPKPEFEDYPSCFFLDKKYVSHDDYQLILSGPDKRTAERYLQACLGFGEDSVTYYSKRSKYEPGVWYHVAFTYDGEGAGRFYLDGIPWGGGSESGRKNIHPGKRPLSIGDRLGSYYHGFPGFIDQVRICNGALEFARARFHFTSERTSFVRMGKNQVLPFELTNLQRTPLVGAKAMMSLNGYARKEFSLPEVGPGKTHVIDCPLDTALRPDTYQLKATLTIPGDRPYQSVETFPITIVPRPLPLRMPVIMWGVGGNNATKEADRLKRIGFTHCLGLGADFHKIWEAGDVTEAGDADRVAEAKQMLNAALINGVGILASLSPGRWVAGNQKEFARVDRSGKPYKRESKRETVCGQFPPVKDFCHNVGASVARTYGAFPAFQGALIHSEVRGHSAPCFHKHDRDAFRAHAGIDIPEEVEIMRGVQYDELPDFPIDGVIPDDDPIYLYLKWLWKEGDGWNGLHTAVDQGLKSTARKDLWTWHDPAVRTASMYGSGGRVDVLSQWTYSYPDPCRIGVATDELFTMAGGAAHDQRVMKMTQIIWYREQTAPKPEPGEQPGGKRALWEEADPEAPFITIAPMHLREAFWTKISRPIRGIMYHGWQSLVPTDVPRGYRYTNPQTQHELARLVKQVVEPLGPTLLQVPDVKSDIAFLESFASQMFARRGTWGWNHGWGADAYLILNYAQLQPEIFYDETIIERGLDGKRVLVMMDCDVVTRKMADKITTFQNKGGLIIADERLTPAIQPDILLQSYERTRKADEDKTALLALAAQLRKELDPYYTRYVDSSNPEVLTRRRRYGTTDYIFAINDRREYGDYVGHHGLVMENGLPADTVLTINRDRGFVYDLVHGRSISAKTEASKLRLTAHLGPCDGRLFMIASQPIQAIHIEGPDKVAGGGSAALSIEIVDSDGKPLDAVVPVRVDIRDAEGRLAEFSGFYGAADGKLALRLDIASNDARGVWQICARELASGLTAEHYMRVYDTGKER